MTLIRGHLKRIIVFLILVAAVSCSVQKVADTKVVDTDMLAIVNGHCAQNDVIALIKDLSLYPAYRDEAEDALFNKIDYSRYNYGTISTFDLAAQEDFRAAAFFDSLKVDIESDALEYISNSSIEGVAAFYKENNTMQNFLNPYIQESYMSQLDTLDYKTLKSLYISFKDTDLGNLINPHYQALRTSLLSEISDALDKYFTSEEEMLEDIEYTIRVSADAYVKDGTESITNSLVEKNSRTLRQRIFNRQDLDRYSFGTYANLLINEHFKPSYITDKVIEDLDGFIESSTDFRLDFCQQYLSDMDSSLFVSNTVAEHQLIWEIGRSHIDEVENIKFTGTALTVGSLALGFVPGIGTIAVAADIADLAYGLTQDGMIDDTMVKLTNALYGDSLVSIEAYLQDVFGDIRSQRSTSEAILRKRLHEEF